MQVENVPSCFSIFVSIVSPIELIIEPFKDKTSTSTTKFKK